ncbi:hypothetical protein [Microvirga solisilvae]|uniref:hypothetical protein n=1 Tax=Microvirga solisilvae TaxID=2919498 RepID=UPI001FB026AC|nr:hypothetical protein [Microvirga solisilvae]
MKRLMLSALAALAFAAPAAAQYYGNPYYEERRPAPRYYEYESPGYGYRPQPYEERRVYRYERPRYERPRYETRRAASGYGHVCVTSRGSCEYPQPFRIGVGCRCDIPGFGMKRGNIGY